MYLYRIFQKVNNNYDTFDSAIVCAPDAEAARFIHPADYGTDEWWTWEPRPYSSWVPLDQVQVKYIGIAAPDIPSPSVVCASYNAG